MTRLEGEGVVIAGRADLSRTYGEFEVTFEGLDEGQDYILLAPEMSGGHITKMWTFDITYEPGSEEVNKGVGNL